LHVLDGIISIEKVFAHEKRPSMWLTLLGSLDVIMDVEEDFFYNKYLMRHMLMAH
jgi:hypothetical protein